MYQRNSNKQDDLEEQLLQAVLNNDTPKICVLIKNNEGLLNYTYQPHNKRILLIACSKDGVQAETVRTLLDLNAKPRDFTEVDGWGTLHWASSNTNYDILKIILERYPDNANDVDLYDNNCLHTLIRYGNKESTDFQKCVELLVEKGVDVNQKNSRNKTSIDWAVKKQLSGDIIEIMTKQVRKNRSEVNDGHILFDYLKEGDIDKFINFKDGNIQDLVNYTEGSNTLLQMCCEKNLAKAVIHLLNKGADHEQTSRKNNSKPIIIAAERGNKTIFSALLDKYNQILHIPKEVLPTILQYIDREYHDNIGCYNTFIEKMKAEKKSNPDEVSFKINEGNKDGNTALHYAVVYAEPSVIEELLSLGASLGAKNKFGTMPIEDIETETLKTHLDACVEFDLKRKKIDKEDFKVTFNYRTLVPPYLQLSSQRLHFNNDVDVEAPSIQMNVEKILATETEVIGFMSQSSKLKNLLTHPTITSFLYLKWLKIYWIFWVNVACYLFFAGSLLTYFFIDVFTQKSLVHYISVKFLKVIFITGSLAILIRELFQMIAAKAKYFLNFENYIELSLMVLSAILAYDIHFGNDTKEHLFAVTILLVAFELILMVGQHPMFSTNVVMFRTVTYNYSKFFLWYSLPIIAFAVSFYLVFSTDITTGNNNTTSNVNTTNNVNTSNVNTTSNAHSTSTYCTNTDKSFDQLPLSFFKTMIMLTGEFNSGDLNFDKFPFTSKLVFAAFVFTMAIILLNLLNGLAVSDTQMIRDDAEVVGYIARTQIITGIESRLIGICRGWGGRFGQYLSEIACLFPKCLDYKLTFYPRKGGLIHRTLEQSRYNNICLDENSILRTNSLIQEKKNEELKEHDDYNKRMDYQQELIEKLLKHLGNE